MAGAGGASRAISFYLARENPQSIHILNRDINKAKSLAEDLKNSKLTDNVDFDSIDKIVGYVSDADILIDTTPVGMSPHVNDEAIVKAEDMHSDLVVNDIVIILMKQYFLVKLLRQVQLLFMELKCYCIRVQRALKSGQERRHLLMLWKKHLEKHLIYE